MTPLPSPKEISTRPIFDPARGSIHVLDLCKLANRKRDRLSDHWVGVLVWGAELGIITKTQGDVFEIDFKRPLQIRLIRKSLGQPFLGPDGLVVTLQGIPLRGSLPNCPSDSPLSIAGIKAHPNYDAWLTTEILGGLSKDGSLFKSKPLPLYHSFGRTTDDLSPTSVVGPFSSTVPTWDIPLSDGSDEEDDAPANSPPSPIITTTATEPHTRLYYNPMSFIGGAIENIMVRQPNSSASATDAPATRTTATSRPGRSTRNSGSFSRDSTRS